MPRNARPWFRVYSEALDNPKLQRLSDRLFKVWFNLACLANISQPRGSLPPMKDIAFRLRTSEKQAEALLRELAEQRLLDVTPTGYAMHDWEGPNGWQYESDARATDGRKRGDSAADSPRYDGEDSPDSPPRAEAEAEAEQKKSRAETEAEAEAEQIDAPPAHPFAVLYSQKYRDRTGGKILTAAVHGRALSLEVKYGAEDCIQVAESKGWERDPSYYVGALEDRKNGNSDGANRAQQTTGASPGGVAVGASNVDRLRAAIAARGGEG